MTTDRYIRAPEPLRPTEREKTVIQLTRLRHGDTFYLNPDLFERVDTHVDTVIRLTDGTEYLVVEPASVIVRRIAEFRAQIIAIASVLQSGGYRAPADHENDQPEHATTRFAAELPAPAGAGTTTASEGAPS